MGKEDIAHPPELYTADMNPEDRAGQNRPGDLPTTTAYEIQRIRERLSDFPDDVLKQIPVLEPGTSLEEGATYFDLANPEAGEFTGMNNIVAEPGSCYVDKSTVDFELWNRLTGVTDPYRLGRFAA